MRLCSEPLIFGPYRIEREIGSGGMGTVYLAHRADGQFEGRVALKLVSRHLRTEFYTQRFLTERQILAQLRHPNITALLDGGVGPQGDPYLVMEYVEGCGMFEYCDSRKLGVRARVRLFLSVCSAVEFAHRHLVIHRDLKPSNILVTPEGTPKLLDFGTAKLLSVAAEHAEPTQVVMTPRYASPEQLRGEPVSAVSDVFSLGVLLHELLTGAWPFGDPSSMVTGMERAIREMEPARTSALDRDLRAVLGKAMAWDAQRRYPSVEQFSADLKRWLDDLPVQAQPYTLRYRTGRWLQRGGWRWALLGAVLLCGLAIAAFKLWSSHAQLRRAHEPDAEARNLYLKGRYYWNKRTPESLNKAIDYFTKAVARDANYAQAYAGLADCYNLLPEFTGMPAPEAFPRAAAAARRALALDDSSAEAHSSLAFDLFWGEWNAPEAEREFQRALALDANYVRARHWHADTLLAQGRMGEALKEIEKARGLDPTSSALTADYGLILFYAGEREEAMALLKQLAVSDPTFTSPHTYLADIAECRGDWTSFLSESQKAAELSQNADALRLLRAAEAAFAAGGAERMLQVILRFDERAYAQGHLPASQVAEICALLDRRQQALSYLRTALAHHEPAMMAISANCAFQHMHEDPGFRDLVKRVSAGARK